jgi:D-glycero-D-manno-heptose 1,7-bisphosphate phosphatase
MKKRAIFLDRDGTINKDVGYPDTSDQIEIYSSSFEALGKINAAGFLAVIITNQSGIGRGYLSEADLEEIHHKMKADFAERGVHVDGIYFCPHYELSENPRYRKDCDCRKPKPGLALRAAKDLGIDLAGSYFIGDKVEDVLFGLNIGARPVLVLTGFGAESEKKLKEMSIRPAHTAPDLLAAVNWILGQAPPQENDPV